MKYKITCELCEDCTYKSRFKRLAVIKMTLHIRSSHGDLTVNDIQEMYEFHKEGDTIVGTFSESNKNEDTPKEIH